MNNPKMNDFQQQTLEALRLQQEAYLAAVRTWRQNFKAATDANSQAAPKLPTLPEMPSPGEMADASYAFATRILDDQRKFLEAVNEVIQQP